MRVPALFTRSLLPLRHGRILKGIPGGCRVAVGWLSIGLCTRELDRFNLNQSLRLQHTIHSDLTGADSSMLQAVTARIPSPWNPSLAE